jgi:hypothetical protein
MIDSREMISGRLNYTKSELKIIPDDASLKQKKELFYSYVMKLKYHMGEMLKMPKENKIKFITLYLNLKFILELGSNELASDESLTCVHHVRNWPKEITEMDGSLAQIDRLLKNLLSIQFSANGMVSSQTRYLKEFSGQDPEISLRHQLSGLVL